MNRAESVCLKTYLSSQSIYCWFNGLVDCLFQSTAVIRCVIRCFEWWMGKTLCLFNIIHQKEKFCCHENRNENSATICKFYYSFSIKSSLSNISTPYFLNLEVFAHKKELAEINIFETTDFASAGVYSNPSGSLSVETVPNIQLEN